jgi:biopolymer transport protein ExbB/TolQ
LGVFNFTFPPYSADGAQVMSRNMYIVSLVVAFFVFGLVAAIIAVCALNLRPRWHYHMARAL